MKLVYAPSGKRIIPYPPMGVAILAARLREDGVEPSVHDLEIEVAAERLAGRPVLLYEGGLEARDVLAPVLSGPVEQYAALMWALLGADAGNGATAGDDALGVSVMGFEQIASALLLARTALERGQRVIFGGQFWTERSAREAIDLLAAFGSVTVTVGDGWEAVAAFVAGRPPRELPNCYSGSADGVVAGPRVTAQSMPPAPSFDWPNWSCYEDYGRHTYHDEHPVRRAHVYVWDKQCNFRCAFCRVATGSRAQLTAPATVSASFRDLAAYGVTQMNLMTNELNPSRKYLLRLLDHLEADGVHGADWFTYVRADHLEREDFARVRALGGRLARYGVESGSQRLLDLMRKDYDVPTMSATLAAAAAEDVFNHINLLIGFPGEVEDDIDRTIDFLAANAQAIHSVRINPFYLPPDTPIARAPHEFGIELDGFAAGWWKYRHADGTEPDESVVVARVERVSEACVALGIGFAGADPFFLLDAIARQDSVGATLARLKQDYPIFWTPAPVDVYKAAIGGYQAGGDWKATVLKRQRNYSLSICVD